MSISGTTFRVNEDSVLARAQKKRAALIEEIRRLDQFIQTYKMLDAETLGSNPASGREATEELAQLAFDMKPVTQANAALALLTKYGPMSVKDMLTHLRAQGITIGGKDPANNLSSILSRSDNTAYDKETGLWKLVAIKPRLVIRKRTTPLPESNDKGGA